MTNIKPLKRGLLFENDNLSTSFIGWENLVMSANSKRLTVNHVLNIDFKTDSFNGKKYKSNKDMLVAIANYSHKKFF